MPRWLSLPKRGVLRLHHDPGALPAVQDQVGPHRFDDPRPGSLERYVVRYTATTLRGCLLECLDWLRPHPEAIACERDVVDNADPRPGSSHEASTWAAIRDFLSGRQV